MFRRIIAIGLLSLLAACQTMPPEESSQTGREVYHFVAVWLKEPADQQALERLKQQCENWRGFPGVLAVTWGDAIAGQRAVVQDYDFGVLIIFESESALRAYEQDPTHQQAIREVLAPAASQVRVYDFLAPAGTESGLDRSELRKRQYRHYQEFVQ